MKLYLSRSEIKRITVEKDIDGKGNVYYFEVVTTDSKLINKIINKINNNTFIKVIYIHSFTKNIFMCKVYSTSHEMGTGVLTFKMSGLNE